MIRSFKDALTAAIYSRQRPKRFPADLVERARRKLVSIEVAYRLADLASPPGNRLEPLKGDREGQHSIRINDQWRVCFRWSDDGADDVEIVDYHSG